MDKPLARLLTRSLVNQYAQWEWFRDCVLKGNVILAPDADLAASLTRCWLPQIRQVMSDAVVQVGTVQEPEKKQAYRGARPAATNGALW